MSLASLSGFQSDHASRLLLGRVASYERDMITRDATLKKIALAFNVTTDWLLFEDGEREPKDELKLKFEAVAQMDADERQAVDSLLDAMILTHQNKRFFIPAKRETEASR